MIIAEQPINNDLLNEINDFIEVYNQVSQSKDMNPTRFGILALNDPAFVTSLKKGRDLRRSTEERVRSFIKSNLPSHNSAVSIEAKAKISQGGAA